MASPDRCSSRRHVINIFIARHFLPKIVSSSPLLQTPKKCDQGPDDDLLETPKFRPETVVPEKTTPPGDERFQRRLSGYRSHHGSQLGRHESRGGTTGEAQLGRHEGRGGTADILEATSRAPVVMEMPGLELIQKQIKARW